MCINCLPKGTSGQVLSRGPSGALTWKSLAMTTREVQDLLAKHGYARADVTEDEGWFHITTDRPVDKALKEMINASVPAAIVCHFTVKEFGPKQTVPAALNKWFKDTVKGIKNG